MKTHTGYETSASTGARCSGCNEWVPEGGDVVYLQPCIVDEQGSARPTAMANHGILCMDCFENAEVES